LKEIEESNEQNVQQFVTRDSVLGRRTQTQKGFGQQNHRTEPADNCGCIEVQRLTVADRAGNPEALLHFAA
jgi:hypothetical protein